MHIEMEDELVAEIDRRAGARGRSRFVRDAVTGALAAERRWDALLSARGSIAAEGHEWDPDPAAWVRRQRRADRRRTG
jgi:Arc/MetJ family transcription regulator